MKPMAIWPAVAAFAAGVAAAAENSEPLPPMPDPAYCSQRDADPRKCVIQDGPPPRPPIVRKKPIQPQAQTPPGTEKPAVK